MDLRKYDDNGNYRYTAVILPTVFGDGKQLIYLGAKNQRLIWYIWVDSKDDLTDYHKPIEKILTAVIEQYELYDEERVEVPYDNLTHYPMVPEDIFDAYHWGTVEAVKLTKSALNSFIKWTTTKYNDYLDYGTKKKNVELVYKALLEGNYKGQSVFTIQCASPSGENANGRSRGRGASNKYWGTKTSGDEYTVDCTKRHITAIRGKRGIIFLPISSKKFQNIPN